MKSKKTPMKLIKIVERIPVDRWFSRCELSLNMNSNTLGQRLKMIEADYGTLQIKIVGRYCKYFMKKEDKAALMAKLIKPENRLKSIYEACFDLFINGAQIPSDMMVKADL